MAIDPAQAQIRTLKDGSLQIAPRTYVEAIVKLSDGTTLSSILDKKASATDLTTETTNRTAADATLQANIDKKADATDLSSEVTRATTKETELSASISNEVTNRQNADNTLQTQIDAINSRSDVVDVVATKAALDAYDKDISINDIIKVIADETNNNATAYYRNTAASKPYVWELIGLLGPYYTQAQTNELVNSHHDSTKQDVLSSQTVYSKKGTGAKVPQITTNDLGQVTNITEVDITKTTLSDLGITASATELNYVDGVTSNIQTQLNAKANSSNLGALASKDSASGTITPSGTISTPTITVTPTTADVNNVTSVGTLPTFKQGIDEFTQGSFTQGVDSFTQGSFTQGKDSFSSGVFSAGTLPTFSYSVTGENLTFSFSQGTLPSHGADKFTQGTDSFTKPTFTQGSDSFVAPTFKAGTDTFSAGVLPTSSKVTVLKSAVATSSQPTFTGKESTIEVS